ncbi:cytochrome P450 [Dacryopinax primogenitus]|uniref:Cytochrome P450 n=1 Tax=Dacryopinax primogenitus (strain DJM 731) TaxID=1858805 RepID=M5FTE3_DACPD|nr:cytochrome P450 [Dacryopinax primogenitus]EJT98649.1 cytochrome P450 [Dacryopinax primogenitus]
MYVHGFPCASERANILTLWRFGGTVYAKNPHAEIVSELGYLGGYPMLVSRSPEVAKQILGVKTDFEKDKMVLNSVSPFGPNVFATNIQDWPRHRKVLQPGFTTRLYQAVWKETINTYYDFMAVEKWEKEPSFIMPDVPAITSKFALLLIAKCGFGTNLAWNEEIGVKITSTSVFILAMLPRWLFDLPLKPLRRLRTARRSLEVILRRLMDIRRAEGLDNDMNHDVFSLLLKANDAEKGSKDHLTDQEVVSNVFLLLLAGHETTSRSVASTLGLLACHPEEQEKAYQEIESVVGQNQDPDFEDFDRFAFVQGCFFEGLRMFPSSPALFRMAMRDTVLSVPKYDGNTEHVAVKAGQFVWVDWIGIGYNARVYPSPYNFIPARWLDPNTETLFNFSYGPRVCIGKKFAITEAVGVLTLILRDYRIEPVLKEGQTSREWEEEWLERGQEAGVGFGPKGYSVQFIRRSAIQI